MAYRFEFFSEIIYTCFYLFIIFSLYRALYGEYTEYEGITTSMLATNIVISFVIGNAFMIDDFFIRNKINDGSIANEFLRPVNFKARILAENLGQSAFNLLFKSFPALLITANWVGMEEPKNELSFLMFLLSLILGYLVLWNISFIVQMTSFWIVNVWSISTIKNVLIDVLSGVFLPIWFLPDPVRVFVSFTPFESIFYSPVQLYLGKVAGTEIILIYMKQILWIILLYLIGEVMWRRGQKKLIVQGG